MVLRILRLASIVFLLFVSTADRTALATSSPTIEELVDCYVATLPEPFNGTILLAIGDEILLNKGYGLANRTYDIPNSKDTRFQIASFTKQITAVLTLRLVQEGLVELHAPIEKYLPDYPKDKASKITLHDLLLHQSGIKHHYDAMPDYFGYHDAVFHTPREYLDLFAEAPLAHEPGEGYTYTTLGYWLIGLILESATETPYPQMLAEYVLDPLRMKDTFVDNNLTIHKKMATGYKRGLDGYVRDHPEEFSNLTASGDVITTTADLHRFQKALHRGGDEFLSKPSRELLFHSHHSFGQSMDLSYLGLLLRRSFEESGETITLVGLGTGSNYGFRSRVTRLLEKDACYIILSNVHKDQAMGAEMYAFFEQILFERLGLLPVEGDLTAVRQPLKGVAVDEQKAKSYEGFYRLGEEDFFGVFWKEGDLILQTFVDLWGAKYAGQTELITEDGNRFLSRDDDGVKYRFVKSPADSPGPYQLEVVRPGQEPGLAVKLGAKSDPDLTPYVGGYYSTELQKKYDFTEHNGRVVAKDFLEDGPTVLTQLEPDFFGCDKGFLVFTRYKDGQVRDFRFRSEGVDNYLFGSLFIKRWDAR